MNKSMIVISGATCTGKSELALQLANAIGGEIINADIGSWYTPLTIGTAKPDWRNEKIRHHMFDILHEPEHFDVAMFRSRVEVLAQEIWDRGNQVIVVGGSAFYIKALWYKLRSPLALDQQKDDHRALDQAIYQSSTSTFDLWQELSSIDPERSKRIHPHDRYRIVRALVIYQLTGQKPSCFEPVFEPIASGIRGIICSRDRAELYNRINQRVVHMMESGWISEVQGLSDTAWQDFLMEKKIIGYDDILKYLQHDHHGMHDHAYQVLIETIAQKTRNYAKRQVTFLSKLKKDVIKDSVEVGYDGWIEEINLTLCDVGLYINGLRKQLKHL